MCVIAVCDTHRPNEAELTKKFEITVIGFVELTNGGWIMHCANKVKISNIGLYPNSGISFVLEHVTNRKTFGGLVDVVYPNARIVLE